MTRIVFDDWLQWPGREADQDNPISRITVHNNSTVGIWIADQSLIQIEETSLVCKCSSFGMASEKQTMSFSSWTCFILSENLKKWSGNQMRK